MIRKKGLTELITGLDQISPNTNTLIVVVRKTGRTFVFGSLTIPAGVKDTTVGRVSEDSVKTGTVRSRDGWFCAIHLCLLFGVRVWVKEEKENNKNTIQMMGVEDTDKHRCGNNK